MQNIKLFNDKKKYINFIVKIAGNFCNLDCAYCYEKNKNIPSGLVSVQELESLIKNTDGACSILLHGGEPLTAGLEHMDAMLNMLRKYINNKVLAVKVQTNAVLLSERWLELLFNKYSDLAIELSLSIDGSETMNYLRQDFNKKNSFKSVYKSIMLLERYKIKFGVLSVVSKNSLNYARDYIDFIKSIKNIRFIKLNALFNVINNKLTRESITPREFAEFIIETAKYYIFEKLYERFPFEPLLGILQRINNKESLFCNYSGYKCLNFISVYPGGMLAACDGLLANDFRININNNLKINEILVKEAEHNKKFEELNKLTAFCENCDIKDFCMAGCLSQRFYFRNNKDLSEDFCNSKHLLFNAFKNFKLN